MPATSGGVPVVKVCDLGYSKELSVTTALHTFVGTSYYIPPEVWHGREMLSQGRASPVYEGVPMDMWAIGVCTLIMLRGAYPFDFTDKDPDAALVKGAELARSGALTAQMVTEARKLVADGRISDACLNVMLACFQKEPSERPTAAALLADAWFTAGAPYPVPVRAPARRVGCRVAVLLPLRCASCGGD
jgi:serine/threonine protein kinase